MTDDAKVLSETIAEMDAVALAGTTVDEVLRDICDPLAFDQYIESRLSQLREHGASMGLITFLEGPYTEAFILGARFIQAKIKDTLRRAIEQDSDDA